MFYKRYSMRRARRDAEKTQKRNVIAPRGKGWEPDLYKTIVRGCRLGRAFRSPDVGAFNSFSTAMAWFNEQMKRNPTDACSRTKEFQKRLSDGLHLGVSTDCHGDHGGDHGMKTYLKDNQEASGHGG